MSHAMTPAELEAALKRWQVPYKPLLGWRSRNRAGHGAWGDMHGVLNHHTAGVRGASADSELKVLKNGRRPAGGKPALPGPLCNVSPDRDGILWLVGWGRANHAGAVRPEILDRLIREDEPVRPRTTIGETADGNAFLYGVEVQNNGRGEKYPDAQLLTLVLFNAAVCDFHGWGPNSVIQHYEATMRKVDMAPIRGEAAGSWLRREVEVALTAGPGKYVRAGWRPAAPPVTVVPAAPAVVQPAPFRLDVYKFPGADHPQALYARVGPVFEHITGQRAKALAKRGVRLSIHLATKDQRAIPRITYL